MIEVEGVPRLRDPVYAEPLLEGDDAKDAQSDFLKAKREELKNLGVKWTETRKIEANYQFLASPQYAGPLNAATFAGWAKRNLSILNKQNKLVAFEVNAEQFYFCEWFFGEWEAGRPIRCCILKARQLGFSTLMQAISYYLTSTIRYYVALTIAHKKEATLNLHRMFERFRDETRYKPCWDVANKEGMTFSRPHSSRIILATAQDKDAGRSATTQFVHMSERAFWPFAAETSLGLLQVVPDEPHTVIVDESTANGVGGVFHDNYWGCKDGHGSGRAFFYPWWIHAKYTMTLSPATADELMRKLDKDETEGVEKFGWTSGQIAWRRRTIADKCGGDVDRFRQEYPATDREAFLMSGRPVFQQDLLHHRRKEANHHAPLFTGSLRYTDG